MGSLTGFSPFDGTDQVNVGRSLDGNYFQGMIDQLVVVQDVLDENEIRAIMREVPLLNLHLDEGLLDESGNAPRASRPCCAH